MCVGWLSKVSLSVRNRRSQIPFFLFSFLFLFSFFPSFLPLFLFLFFGPGQGVLYNPHCTQRSNLPFVHSDREWGCLTKSDSGLHTTCGRTHALSRTTKSYECLHRPGSEILILIIVPRPKNNPIPEHSVSLRSGQLGSHPNFPSISSASHMPPLFQLTDLCFMELRGDAEILSF